MPKYNPAAIEPCWQAFWEENKTFKAPELPKGRKLYVLDMFPYPSGSGLHVGHPEGYTATDIFCRCQRMRGTSVLHPIGFDAFGLPAEEHAIQTNTPPRQSTENNIATFRRQLKMLGFSYDWDRELATTDVEYFRWTQWIFLLLFDTWFDPQQQTGRPIAELPIPSEVQSQGQAAVALYRDQFRLAYQSDELVNWCPALGTVLANEEVIDGKSERGGHPVQRIPLRQWMLRITAYADRLENDLADLDWSEGIKKLQADWIGRSTGADADFFVGKPSEFAAWKSTRQSDGYPQTPDERVLRVYTTRPDTLFGATYMVIAPEHPLVDSLTTEAQRAEVEKYLALAASKSDRERQQMKKTKTGVFSGSYAINPVNGQQIPIWIADYVLASYGTGAIMAVPAHDERDFEFATQFGLKVIPVYEPAANVDIDREQLAAGRLVYSGRGTAINSADYDGLETEEFKRKIIDDLQRDGLGRAAVNYKLRDWLFSRQRFWGEPFPILHELDADGQPTGMIRPVDECELPVDLPQLDDFKPHGRPEPPLAKADDQWLYQVIDGVRYRRETNTMPQWAGSCWYYLRFIDPRNDRHAVDPEKEKQWMPVDLYIGGAEHAVLHLLYARFWHKVLFDRGYVSTAEPFQKLVNQGMILGELELSGFQTADGQWVSYEHVTADDEGQVIHKQDGQPLSQVRLDEEQAEKQGEFFVLKSNPQIRVEGRAYKMSKSRGNVVNPDEIVADYGADSLRLYEMFMGPLEAAKPWSMSGVNGIRSFLDRAWRMIVDEAAEEMKCNASVGDHELTDEQRRVVHKTIKAVSQDIDSLSFNTAIARLMEFVNFFTKQDRRPIEAMEPFVLLLSTFAPHIGEELWRVLGHVGTLAYEPWPQFDEQWTVDQDVEIPVQINGKVRAKIRVPRGTNREQLEAVARSDDRVDQFIDGKTVSKVIVVPDRLVNFVVKA